LEETRKEKERIAQNSAESLLLDSAPPRFASGWQWTGLRPVPQRSPASAASYVSAECTSTSLSRHLRSCSEPRLRYSGAPLLYQEPFKINWYSLGTQRRCSDARQPVIRALWLS